MQKSVETILKIFSHYNVRFDNEKQLQADIVRIFNQNEVKFEREVRLSEEDIIDFLLDDGIGIECKIKGSSTKLIRQLYRYASHEKIKTLIVITSRNRLAVLPDHIGEKQIYSHVFSVL